jgi:uncharacterized protein (DUF433 family)
LEVTINDRVTIDPKICHGKPVIRGTRTPVAIVVGSLAGGMSFDEIQREYDLTAEDIRVPWPTPPVSWNRSSIVRYQYNDAQCTF